MNTGDEGTLLPAISLLNPILKMVQSTIVVASEDPGTLSLSGVATGSLCPTVYNSVQMCVYHLEAKAEEFVCVHG